MVDVSPDLPLCLTYRNFIKMLLSIGMLMLSATQIYTILTVQLFAFLNLLPVEADILAVSVKIWSVLHKIFLVILSTILSIFNYIESNIVNYI